MRVNYKKEMKKDENFPYLEKSIPPPSPKVNLYLNMREIMLFYLILLPP